MPNVPAKHPGCCYSLASTVGHYSVTPGCDYSWGVQSGPLHGHPLGVATPWGALDGAEVSDADCVLLGAAQCGCVLVTGWWCFFIVASSVFCIKIIMRWETPSFCEWLAGEIFARQSCTIESGALVNVSLSCARFSLDRSYFSGVILERGLRCGVGYIVFRAIRLRC